MTTARTGLPAFERVSANLFASPGQVLSFAPGMHVRAFLIRGDRGNLLLNASEGVVQEAVAVENVGGLHSVWLGHWHERLTAAQAIAERFNAPVYIHEDDLAKAAEEVSITGTFGDVAKTREDIEIIHIPGHTPGSVAFLWHGGEARSLFTADSLFVKDGALRGAMLDSSDRIAYLASLRRLRKVEFDLLVPWVSDVEAPVATPYTPESFRTEMDAVIARIEAGEDG